MEMANCNGCKHLVGSVTACAADKGENGHVILPGAKEMRDVDGKCGPEGKLFEPTLLAWVMSWFHA
jgi:hypothetical protein